MEKLIRFLLNFFWGNAFSSSKFALTTLMKYVFFQKVLRVNSQVEWPVHWSSVIKSPGKMQRGNRNPGMSPWCYIDARNGIEIGENVWIGPRVSIISMHHNRCDFEKYLESEPICIGDNCWLATGCTVTAGVRLGEHVVVAAGAVVTKSFPCNVLIGGVPAEIIKELPPYGTIHKQEIAD